MTAGIHNFTIEQGTTFTKTFSWKTNTGTADNPNYVPVDLTGTTAKMQVWDKKHQTKLIDFNTQGTVDIDGPNGTITIGLSDDFTTSLDFDIAKYDLKLNSPAQIKTRLIQGSVTFSRQETV